MQLRRAVDKHLPLHEGEGQLSEQARQWGFRDFYMLQGDMIKCKPKPNHDPSSRDNLPWKHVIVRQDGNGRRFFTGDGFGNTSYKTPDQNVADELNKPAILARINRVQKVARRIKLAASGVVVATVFGGVGLHAAEAAPTPPGIEQCADVVDGTQSLLRLQISVQKAEQLGETGCKLGDYNYEFSQPQG